MSKHVSFKLKPVIVAVIAATVASGAVLASTESKDTSGINEQVSVSPGHQISPQDEAVVSSAAVKVLRHIAEARGQLSDDKPDTAKAKEELDQTEKLLDIIQAVLPTTKVKDRIWVAQKHLEYENTHEVLPDLVPIYSGLDELVDYMPTAKAKGHLDEAKQALEKDDKSKAKEQLEAVDDALVYVEADLPLSSTRHLVAQAKAFLAKDDAKAANEALAAAEDNVVFVSVSFQSPLTDAKAALWRAWQDFNLGEKEYAKADLDEAVKHLDRAAEDKDPVARKAAEGLVSEVRDLHGMLEADGKDFEAKLEGTWHRIQALSDRSVEYLSTGWQRLRAEGAGKNDLIEAKLQLAYARIDHLYSKDDDAAKVDLAAAKGHLDAAAEAGAPDTKKKVEAIASLVDGLEQGIARGSDKAGDPNVFNQAESELSTLIRQL
jgi:hypothetical protein